MEILPQLLRRNPEIATTIEGILAPHFPRRDEFARLLDELAEHRAETAARFTRVDERFDRVDADIKELKSDLQRAVHRAHLLEKLTGCRTIPIGAGQCMLDAVRVEAERIGAGWLLRPQ